MAIYERWFMDCNHCGIDLAGDYTDAYAAIDTWRSLGWHCEDDGTDALCETCWEDEQVVRMMR